MLCEGSTTCAGSDAAEREVRVDDSNDVSGQAVPDVAETARGRKDELQCWVGPGGSAFRDLFRKAVTHAAVPSGSGFGGILGILYVVCAVALWMLAASHELQS